MIIDKYLTNVRKEINFSYKGYDVSMTITVNGGSCKVFKDGKLQTGDIVFSYFAPPQDLLEATERGVYAVLNIMNSIENIIRYNYDPSQSANRLPGERHE